MALKNFYPTIKVLSVIGIILAAYLLFEQITQSPFRPCNINAQINCNAVISGEVASTLGISTPLYGLIGYIVIFIAAHLKKHAILFGTATFGLVFCLRLAYIELFQLHVICPLCIACQIIMATVFILSLILTRSTSR